MAASIFKDRHFRFRNDDGSEASATWKAGLDTAISLPVPSNTNLRLRLLVEVTSQNAGAFTLGLNVSHNGGAAAAVNGTSSYVQGVVSSNLTDGANTTEQLCVTTSPCVPDTGDTYATQPGVVNAAAAVSHTLALNVSQETEVEWSLVLIASQLAPGDTLDFTMRLVSGAGSVTQYAGNIRLTVSAGGSLMRNDMSGGMREFRMAGGIGRAAHVRGYTALERRQWEQQERAWRRLAV